MKCHSSRDDSDEQPDHDEYHGGHGHVTPLTGSDFESEDDQRDYDAGDDLAGGGEQTLHNAASAPVAIAAMALEDPM